MKKLFLASAALVTLNASGSALAADMPVKAPPPPAPIAWSWTGFYIGVHGGGAWGSKDWDLTSHQFPPGPVFPHLASSGSHTVNGFIGGIQGGVNWQVGWVVLGIEAQWSWGDVKGHGSCFPNLMGLDSASQCASKVKSLATVAGRIGGAIDHALLYVKGGGAWSRDEYTFSSASGPPLVPNFSIDPTTITDNRWGWMIGTGIEYAFTSNWSGKIEYDYLDFGTKSYEFAGVAFGALPAVFNVDIAQRIHLVKVGLNYRFGDWGKYPVAVRAAY